IFDFTMIGVIPVLAPGHLFVPIWMLNLYLVNPQEPIESQHPRVPESFLAFHAARPVAGITRPDPSPPKVVPDLQPHGTVVNYGTICIRPWYRPEGWEGATRQRHTSQRKR